MISGEGLARTPQEVLGTLLHEAAHAVNHVRGVKDCSRSQYHNERFRVAAEELGLSVQRVPNYGWASTTLPKETAERYRLDVACLHTVLIHRRKAASPPATPTGGDTPTTSDDEDAPRSRHLKATCACSPPYVIRASRKTLGATTIRCETFTVRIPCVNGCGSSPKSTTTSSAVRPEGTERVTVRIHSGRGWGARFW